MTKLLSHFLIGGYLDMWLPTGDCMQGGLEIIYGPGIQPPKPNCMPSYQLLVSLQRLTDIMTYN